jgi:hypothetical protein
MRLCAHKQEVYVLKGPSMNDPCLLVVAMTTNYWFGISRSKRHPSTRLGSTPPPSRLSVGVPTNMDYLPVVVDCRSMHSFLELPHCTWYQLHRYYRITNLQPGMVQNCNEAQSNCSVEVPIHAKDCHIDWSYVPRASSCGEPRWIY